MKSFTCFDGDGGSACCTREGWGGLTAQNEGARD